MSQELPADPTDPQHWAVLYTRARLRKGWSYLRLSVESGVSKAAVHRACTRGQCHTATAQKLNVALGITFSLPASHPILTAQQAQRG